MTERDKPAFMRDGHVPQNLPTLEALRQNAVPRIEWSEFARSFAWLQGEHIGLIGPTGSGKTTLALSLLPFRKYITIFATKPRDRTLDELLKHKFKRVKSYREWEELPADRNPRRILWPPSRSLDAYKIQRREFLQTLGAIYGQGAWCVYFDELWMMCAPDILGLETVVKVYLQQARSIGISVLAGTQRPAFVPLAIYDQSTHLFFWRDNDERNLTRLSNIAWTSANLVRATIANLELHEVLYINTKVGETKMVRFFPPAAWDSTWGPGTTREGRNVAS